MRKLYILFILVVLSLTANFIAWFIHTQTLRNSVYNTTVYAAQHGINISYKDIKFTNFRAWDVAASIEDIKINRSVDNHLQELHLHSIKLRSNPFQHHLTLKLPNHAILKEDDLFGSQEFEIKALDSSKHILLEAKLFGSVSKFYRGMAEGNLKLYKHIKKVKFKLPEMAIIDLKNNHQTKATLKSFLLTINSQKSDESSSSNVGIKLNEFKLNPEYTTLHKGVQKIHDKGVMMGILSTDLEFLISRKENWGLLIDHFDVHTDLVNIKTNKGKVTFYRDNALPDFAFEFEIENYKQLTNYYITFINSVILEYNFQNPQSKIKSVSEMQLNSLNALLKKISLPSKQKDTIVLSIEKDKNGMYISQKPAIFILNQLQALFIASLPSFTNMPAPEPKSEN